MVGAVLLGAACSVVGTMCGGLGDNLVRWSYAHAPSRMVEQTDKAWYRRPMTLWLVGWGLTMIVNTLCNMSALALAPLATIVPLGALHIAWGSMFARVINKEHMSRGAAKGVAHIITGVVLVLLVRVHDIPQTAYDDAVAAVFTSGLAAQQCCVAALCTLCALVASRRVRHAAGRVAEPLPRAWVAAAQSRFAKLYDRDAVRRLAPPALAGLLGSSSNLWLKVSLSLLACPGWRVSRLSWWIVVGMTGTVAAAQLTALNHALAVGRASDVIPVANGMLLMGGTLAGVVIGPVDSSLGVGSLAALLAGVVAAVSGIAQLAKEKEREERDLREGAPPGAHSPAPPCSVLPVAAAVARRVSGLAEQHERKVKGSPHLPPMSGFSASLKAAPPPLGPTLTQRVPDPLHRDDAAYDAADPGGRCAAVAKELDPIGGGAKLPAGLPYQSPPSAGAYTTWPPAAVGMGAAQAATYMTNGLLRGAAAHSSPTTPGAAGAKADDAQVVAGAALPRIEPRIEPRREGVPV